MLTASRSQSWSTTPKLFAGIDADYHFTIDGAASALNTKCSRFVDEQTDAFKFDFTNERVWCNPPFGQIAAFLDLGRYWERRNSFWCFIVPAHVETAWFHDIAVWGEKHVFRGRVAYSPADGVKASSPPFPSMLVLFGSGVVASGYGFSKVRCGKRGVLL